MIIAKENRRPSQLREENSLKVLLAYYSRSGNTEKIAQKIAQGIEESGGEVDLVAVKSVAENNIVLGVVKAILDKKVAVKAKTVDCRNYDLICLGTPVWLSHPAPQITSYIDLCENLAGKKAAVFVTLGGTGGEGTIQKMKDHLDQRAANVVAAFEFSVGPRGKHLKSHKLQEAINFGKNLVLEHKESV